MISNKKIAIILGTRPEIIKLSPVIRECVKRKLNFFIIHTNQHYDENMDKIFFKDLKLPIPKYNLKIFSGTHAEQTGKALIGIEKILLKEKPDIVIVQGDTNTTLAGSLAAVKLHIKVAHIEAGLRSYDRNIPEEINRIFVDHISDYLFAPTKNSANILKKEDISQKKIFIVGNTIVDAIYQNLKIAYEKSTILNKLNISPNNYFLLTLHRSENVDNKYKLLNIFKGLQKIIQKFERKIIFPIHPRTKKNINIFKISLPKGVELIPPVGFLDFLILEKNSLLIFTDSGGVQEEACVMKVPCLTLRNSTERPETIAVGANILVRNNYSKIPKYIEEMLSRKRSWRNPFGNGRSASRIINILLKS